MRLRCATLNLQGLENDWFGRRFRIATDGLRRQRLDLLCLQESTIRHRGAAYNQAEAIGEAIGLNVVAFSPYGNPIEVMSSEQGGVAVLSRWPIQSVRNRRLPIGHDEPPDARVALLVTVKTPAGPLDVINVHLSWWPQESPIRLVQLGLLLEESEVSGWDARRRAVLMGDFNAIENEPVIELVRQHLQDAFRARHPRDPGYTWVGSNPLNRGWQNMPDRRLDYIFCPTGVNVRRAEVFLNKRCCASDHFAVMAELEWPRAKRARPS